MPEVKKERNYVMWFESFDKEKGKIIESNVYIGLAEDEEGFDFDYAFIPTEAKGNVLTLNFSNTTNYKFIGIKTFENPRLNHRYSLGTYEFIEPDEATRFNYMMLGRLKSDCEYVVGHLSNFCKRKMTESSIANNIWGASIERHFLEMYRLYDQFSKKEKPQWLTREQIDAYKYKIKKLVVEE